eukprot:evm.model.scf_415.6 EVM.evm.TU.scf_415.6   scf_415:43971-46482(-)
MFAGPSPVTIQSPLASSSGQNRSQPSPEHGPLGLSLDDDVVNRMDIGAVFNKENTARINSLDFHRTVDLLVTASDDDSIHLYNTDTGTQTKTLHSRKYGCQQICFTHHENAVLTASNKGQDHSLRYLSLHDNRYLRYFPGHEERCTSLCMSPRNDFFLSGSQDKTVRLWDLRGSKCLALLEVPVQPCAAFDHQGLIFAVATAGGVIKLYDINAYDKGPFDTFSIADENKRLGACAYVKFSNDGKYILAVMEGRIYVIDAFTGNVVQKMMSGVPEGGTALEACFSPDGQYVLSGCEDRTIHVWNATEGNLVACWKGHAGNPTCVKWASTKAIVASACTAVALWIPNFEKDQDVDMPDSISCDSQSQGYNPSSVQSPVGSGPSMVGPSSVTT